MSKEKGIIQGIPAIYKSTAIDLLFFAWMLRHETLFPNTRMKGIDAFMDEFKLNENEFNSDSAMITYNRMSKKFKQEER